MSTMPPKDSDKPIPSDVKSDVTQGETNFEEDLIEEESFLENKETTALIGSMLVHLIIVLTLALVPLKAPFDEEAVVIVSPPEYQQEKIEEIIDDVTYSELPQVKVGADSIADSEMAEASAEMFAEVAEIPNPIDLEPTDLGQIMVDKMFQQAVAPLDKLTNQKGKVGQGTEGASGAVDRITFEILKMLEERPTMVVWLFDQSGSLHRQRREIRDRFDRIYTELGIAEESGAKRAGAQPRGSALPSACSEQRL